MTKNVNDRELLGNIYHMTNAAAKRVYQLRKGAIPKVEPTLSYATTALKEIEEGKIGLGILIHDKEL